MLYLDSDKMGDICVLWQNIQKRMSGSSEQKVSGSQEILCLRFCRVLGHNSSDVSQFTRHLGEQTSTAVLCCCILCFLVVIAVSYKTAAAVDVVAPQHSAVVAVVQTEGSGPHRWPDKAWQQQPTAQSPLSHWITLTLMITKWPLRSHFHHCITLND